jgi:DNA-binding CsgD family transcriptional regulator
VIAPTGGLLLREGRDAIAAADLARARACFEEARELDGSPEALDGLSEVANFEGEYELAIGLKEEAFAAYRERDKHVEASHAARWLGFMHGTYHGNYAVASGWIARAESLLEGIEECAAHGWLILDRAPFSRSPEERQKVAASALGIARRFGDADLEFEAIALLGESHVALGRIDEGMKLLDEAMAAIAGGEIADHKAIGEIYCRLLSACEHATDVRRAEDWVSAIDRHVLWTDFVRPTCRTHYGGILIALGRWQEAEVELLAAIKTFERGYRGDGAFPLVRLAELRVRQGRFEEAERLLENREWHPLARRAAARIALGRRELALAEELARLCFEGEAENDPACGPALELLVAVQLARGDQPGARSTLDRLAALAASSGSPALTASAALAAGRVAIAGGEDNAVGRLKGAVERFAALELPFETARARLELARALAPTAPEAAAHEARLALDEFERLGAAYDCDAAAELLRTMGASGRAWPKGRGPLTKRETEVLALLVEGLANAEIAERLFISVRTAEHHVASILAKLDLRSRAEAAAYGARQGAGKDR